jgi:D-alanyl-D-alanine endopeptidase (penicillin-binding protein 7)
MLNKFISLLLLSPILLANAASEEVVKPAQSSLSVLEQNDVKALAVVDKNQHGQDSLPVFNETANTADLDRDAELTSDEADYAEESRLHKAYDYFLNAIPKLDFLPNKNKEAEVNTDNVQPQDDLNTVVRKFAAMPRMRSSIVLIYDEKGKKPLHSKNADVVTPIASITKLMTAMVVLDAKLPLDEEISISPMDINRQKRTRSRMPTGMTLTRGELLKLALMASDNLSAAALARTYPGGTEAALVQMNAKARELGMNSSQFMDPTGLNSGNVSTANDLVKMVHAAQSYELIHQFTTSTSHTLERTGHRPLRFHNTNPLVKNASWDIGLSKTGYISEAGRCLVMEAKITEQPVIIVLLDSWGRNSRVGDANRVKKWMEKASYSPKQM